MSFSRITEPVLTTANIAALADRPKLTAAALKAKFDEAGGDIAEFLAGLVTEVNALIDALEASTSAANLGASAVWGEDDSAANIQAKLTALKTYMDNLVIAAGAGDMLKSVYDSDSDWKVDSAEDADKLGGVDASGYAKEIAGQNAKTSIADADAFPLADSEDSATQKKTLWSTMKSALQTAFAGVFAAISHSHTISDLSGVAASSHTHSCSQLSGVMSDSASQTAFTAIADADYIPIFDSSTSTQKKALFSTIKAFFALASHTHGVTDLSGVVKNTAGIRVSVQSSAPTSPTTNDLWVWDESAS